MAMKQITKGYPNWDVPYNENVEEYNKTIGNTNMETTATTITGAIKEVRDLINTKGGEIQTVVADVNNNKTKIAEHTSQLNTLTNDKAPIESPNFTGVAKLNGYCLQDSKVYTKVYSNSDLLNGWQNTTDEDWARIRIIKIGNVCQLILYEISGSNSETPILTLPDFCNSAWIDDRSTSGIKIVDKQLYTASGKKARIIFTWLNS